MEELAAIFRIGYFNWALVAAYVALLAVFLYGLLQPRKKTEWKSAGAAQAWVIALYAEMYGVPLTAYLAMSVLGKTTADAETHFNGHLWPVLMGFTGENLVTAQFAFTVVGQIFVAVGAVLAIVGWRQIHRAVKENRMATDGLYGWIRHPQYTGFFLFLTGSMINWPTLVTMMTLPLLCWVYWRLALKEEQDAIETFGESYRSYMRHTGRFLPRLFMTNN